jgi:pimeloyl-ACP methyl ester carboxylesterase
MGALERHAFAPGGPWASGESGFWSVPLGYDSTRSTFKRCIIFCHGYDSSTSDGGKAFEIGGPLAGHAKAYADQGYLVISADLGGGTFGAYLGYDRILDIITWVKATFGIPAGNFVLVAHSMGTGVALAFMRYSWLASIAISTVIRGAWLWAVAADIANGYGLAGWTPPATEPAPGGFTAPIAAGFGLTGQTAKNVQASATLSGATLQMSTTINRAWQHQISRVGSITFTIGAGTITATGVSTTTVANDTLTGVSSSGAVSWAAGAAITATYAQVGIDKVSPASNIADYQTAIGTLPVRCCTSSNDSVVGPALTTWLVGQMGRATFTEYSPEPALDHTGPYLGVSPATVLAWINSLPGWV